MARNVMSPEKWEELSRRASLGLSFSGPMATDIMAYAKALRVAVEAAYREGVNEGFDTDEVPDSEREWQIETRWQRSAARQNIERPKAPQMEVVPPSERKDGSFLPLFRKIKG